MNFGDSPLRHLTAWAIAGSVMIALDMLWIGGLARSLYREGIGHLMADHPNLAVAGLFYAVYATGLVIFVIAPFEAGTDWRKIALRGALYGGFAYATYDLTNLATLRQWPASLAAIDIAWGCFASAAAACAGRFAFDWIAVRH